MEEASKERMDGNRVHLLGDYNMLLQLLID